MNTQALPAGLIDSNGEFFVNDNGVPQLLKDRMVVAFENFGGGIISILERKLLSIQRRHAAITKMVNGAGRLAELKQLVHCLYGGFDNEPDMLDDELKEPEFWACKLRGICQYEGIACTALLVANGKYLTRREIEHIRLTAQGLINKEIAAQMGISILTVETNAASIRAKTGLRKKPDFTRFAMEKRLI